jgi:DNA-binding MarR family transcriptional regulator
MGHASPSFASAADLAVEPAIEQTRKRDIESLLRTLKPLANLRGSIPLPFVTTFLMIALDEGKGVNAYARAVGIHRAAMSRYIRNIGDQARNGRPGLGLVRVEPNPAHPRSTKVILTTKGRSISNAMFQKLKKRRWPGPSVGSGTSCNFFAG